MSTPPLNPAPAFPALPTRCAAVRAWWREPRLTWWVLVAFAAALALRKPHALVMPQLWAEDGSVFLLDQDRIGTAALGSPYMGYLHTIPRLTAWIAAHLLDPAWWPAFYNGVAFAIWLAVVARTLSARLPLAHRPWLAAACFLGPQTGEILFNITNVQWIAALVLVQQAIIASPTNGIQRCGDLLLLAVVSLTGPFAVALLPLFAWRCWRERRTDNIAILLLVAACATIQAWFIHRANITFEHQHAPLHLGNALVVLSRRLIVWPLLGPRLASDLPPAVVGVLGTAFGAALCGWALRPHPRRLVRMQLLAACALLMLAGFLRMRPDTWTGDDLAYSDRYFFLPRVLLAWLIILEIDATPQPIAWAARFAAAFLALVHLPNYTLPAPPDYRWADHCEAIRRGVPARIPILPEEWILDYPGRPAARP